MKAQSRLRVRYAETDAMGIVYYANYLVWMEVARVDMLREAGLDYRQVEASGIAFPVVEVQCTYRRPARFDDLVVISAAVTETASRRLTISYEIHKEEGGTLVLLGDGYTRHACVNAEGRPIALPEPVMAVLKRLMSGDPTGSMLV
ncbi:acyl-CoA thioesterase [bacterium]|nr:acyl-CoA thioesterase [candidate division CSSED10-310 bacterium]